MTSVASSSSSSLSAESRLSVVSVSSVFLSMETGPSLIYGCPICSVSYDGYYFNEPINQSNSYQINKMQSGRKDTFFFKMLTGQAISWSSI